MDANIDSRNLALLDPDFADKVRAVITTSRACGAVFVPFFTVRGPIVQAKLWAQSRPIAEPAAKRATMTLGGAPRLAALLLDEYAARGKQVTNAAPGESWHQWGEACDCFIERAGAAVWSSPLYKTLYAVEAVKVGLTAGANWKGKLQDQVHVQAAALSSPLDGAGATWATVEQHMLERYEF